MVTLTYASITARKIIRYTVFFIIFLIVGKMFLGVALGIYHKIFPPPPPTPTVAYGKLPKLPFPERAKLNLNFTLETPEGGLPTTPSLIKIYFMPKLSANLLSLDFAKERAQSLNYEINPETLSDSLYKFYNKTTPSSMQIDIITGAFSVSYDLNVDQSPLAVRPVPPEVAVSTARQFMTSANVLPEDMTGPTSHQFLKYESSGLVPAVSLADSNLIKVHFFRKSFEEMPSLTPVPNEGNIWFIISGLKERGKDVLAGEYHYFPVDETQSSTYPIKTADQAWQEFTAGNYFTASFGAANDGENIKIRRVYLAYYDSGELMDFYQPIYVFEGTDKNFVAYIPAVTGDYYGE